MNEFEKLARAVEAERPPIPPELLRAQRDRLLSDPRARVSVRRRSPAVIGAGLGALLAVAGVLFAIRADRASLSQPDVPGQPAASAGGGSEQRLADGTQIRLEAGARGHLTESGAHEVRFNLDQGRADFDVAPNPRRTFLVVAGLYQVRVLGTRFSVDYEPARRVSVAVRHGVVTVVSPAGVVTRLEAGDRLDVSDDRSNLQPVQPLPATPLELAPPSDVTPPESPVGVTSSQRKTPQPHNDAKKVHASESDALRASWRRALASGNYAEAVRSARGLDLDRLAAELGPVELAELADAARLGGEPAVALVLLHALEDRFPDAEQGARATFLMGRLLERQGQPLQAISAFERYLARNPQGTYANEARGRLMAAYEANGDAARATSTAQTYLAHDPEGPYRRLARSLLQPR